MSTANSDQKRKARIDKLIQALREMRPFRRRGDAAALKRIDGELQMLRATRLRSEKKRASSSAHD